ncbi:MAG TPA: hypothetical protein DCZ94_18905 [Lentisphaeria bacterium]|nr:MAG: hypothetical protein A2X48_21995 [Lentisphaerae bacterium GWF2_49_21]HBC89014.1 hypothetical protein [Lentisphaeria bacterium]
MRKTVKIGAMFLVAGMISVSALAQDPLANGLTFYAPLDGSADATLAVGSKTPAVNKETKFVEGKFGQGVELKDKAQLYYSGDMNFNISEGTVAFWVKRYEKWSGGKKSYILFKSAVANWNKSSLYLTVTEWGQLRAWVFPDDGKQSMIMSPNGIPYVGNEWYHMAMTYKDGSVKIYVNGAEISYGAEKSDPMIVMPTGIPKHIQFGCDYDGAKLNGVMDELRIYKRVLSADEIKKLYEFVPGK